jgi:hypothetical protein
MINLYKLYIYVYIFSFIINLNHFGIIITIIY